MANGFFQMAIVFAAVYFFSLNGLGALPNLTVSFLLKNEIKMNAAQMSYFHAVTFLAWVIKPLWGYISDCFPIAGSRRKSYLLLTSFVVGLAWLLLALTKNFMADRLLLLISIAYMAYAFQDVVTDGLMVEVGKPQNLTGRFQSIQWGAVYLAIIITSVCGGYISDLTQRGTLSYQSVFGITGLFPLLTILIAAFLIHEPRSSHLERKAELGLKEVLRRKDIWILSLFLFCWNFSPSFGAPFFYYAVDTLKLSGSFLGILRGTESFGALVGSVAYGIYIVKIPIRKFLIFSIFAGIGCILTYFVYFLPALIANVTLLKSVALITHFLFGVMSCFIFLTLLNLAAKVSPQYAGGTIFALLTSFYNLGLMGSNALGGFLYSFMSLKALILISAAFSLFVLVFLPYLPIPEELTAFELSIRKILRRLGIGQAKKSSYPLP